MKKQILAAGVLCATLFAITAKTKDPVLMKVGDKDVRLSEFEYLYNKNNSQQAQPQSVDDYLGMFVNFKLKVAAAEAAGLDTTASFLDEYTKFRNELAEPYMQDSAARDAQLREAYSHKLNDLYVSHIMVRNQALADSLYTALKNGTANYEEVARRYSVDKPSAQRGGRMGTVTAGRYPWPFEKAAYETPVGQLSPVVNSGFGYHIIRVESSTPAKGQVHAAHILRMTRGVSDSVAAAQQTLIDSLYNVLASNPEADFGELARTYSQDPGSARSGGDLGFFPSGAMVAEFDSVAFAIADGEISKPVKTAFGWHIIKRIESKGTGTFDESKADLIAAIDRDPARKNVAMDAYIDSKIKEYGAQVNPATIAKVKEMAAARNGEATPELMAEVTASKLPVFTLKGKKVTLADMAAYIPSVWPEGADNIAAFIENSANDYIRTLATEQAREDLALENPDYRNLTNEYRDGILLFEISNRKVWNHATSDTVGLENFFRANRDKYRWEAPRFKGIVIFAGSDSLLNVAMKYAADSIAPSVPSSEIATLMNKRFGRDVKVERVIAAKGDNAITDYLGFGQERPAPASKRWASYAAFRGKVIDQPEEAADVRGPVVADYQALLEKDWLDELHRTIPVKINQKVLRQAK